VSDPELTLGDVLRARRLLAGHLPATPIWSYPAAAAYVVAAAVAPGCRIIAVQSSASPAGYHSWRAGTLERRPNRTATHQVTVHSGGSQDGLAIG
jgi:hypothetical protein